MPRQFEDLTIDMLEQGIQTYTVEIRKLETEAAQMQAEIKPVQERRARALSNAANMKTALVEMEQEIIRRRAPRPEPTVTDHALLRYIERVCEIDIEALREHILTPTVRQAIQSGATAVKTAEFMAVVKGNAITTITTPEVHPERKNNKLTRAQRERLEEDDEPRNYWGLVD